MQKHLLLPAILLMFLFSGCHPPENISGKIWFFTHSTESPSKELPDSTLTANQFFDLEEDGTYNRDFGNFDYRGWAYNNHQIIFTSYSKNKSIILVNFISGNEMQAGPNAGPIYNFESQPNSFRYVIENPFQKKTICGE